MKHTFYFIDKLMVTLQGVPKELKTSEDFNYAKAAVSEIKKIVSTLRKMVDAYHADDELKKLCDSHMREIEGWRIQASQLVSDFKNLLALVENDTKILEEVIEKNPGQWADKVSDMALGMVMTRLHDETEVMKKLKELEIFEEKKLKEIIVHEHHIAEIFR